MTDDDDTVLDNASVTSQDQGNTQETFIVGILSRSLEYCTITSFCHQGLTYIRHFTTLTIDFLFPLIHEIHKN